jgi:hypothetical protein
MRERISRSTYDCTWSLHYLEASADAFPQEKELPILIALETGWAPETVWKTWRNENSCLHRDLNFDQSVVYPVANRLY